jgi:hypothetical protein
MVESQLLEEFIVVTAEQLATATGPNREVLVHLQEFEKHIGLAPGVGVMIRLSPAEARRFAQSLIDMADKAEEGLPRA